MDDWKQKFQILPFYNKLVSRIKFGQYSVLKQKLEKDGGSKIGDFLKSLEEKDVLALQITKEMVPMVVKTWDAIISLLNPEKIVLYDPIWETISE